MPKANRPTIPNARKSVEVKQFGLPRSGTNVLKWMLEHNYFVNVLVNAGGWKHGSYRMPELLGREVHVVVSAMHPLPWLVNYYRYKRPSLAFPAWVRAEEAIHWWNWAYGDWMRIQLNEHRLASVRYEELILKPVQTLRSLGYYMGLEQKADTIEVPQSYVDPHPPKGKKVFDATWFTEGRFMGRYTSDLVSFVKGLIDSHLMTRLGYDWESWNAAG